MQQILDDIRCPHCHKLLARGQALEMKFKCPRCGTFFVLRATRPSSEPPHGQRSDINGSAKFDNVTLYKGNALVIQSNLPSSSVDAVLTDTQYSSGGASLSAKQADPASKYQQSVTRWQYPPMIGDAKDQRSWTHWCMLWLAECWRVSRDGAPLMVFTDWRQLPALTDAAQGAGWRW